MHIDHPSHAIPGIKPFPARLYVITAISNPVRYRRRYELYRAFEKQIHDAGAILYTAECAFGDREFEVTESTNPRHLQLRTSHELWHKENMLNLLIAKLPAECKHIAWIDADVTFTRIEWAQETLHALQHYHVVQPWSHSFDTGPYGEIIPDADGGESLPSMMHQYVEGSHWDSSSCAYASKHKGHCGYAWAARREAIDIVGGLFDVSILGANDHHMARAFLGDAVNSVHKKMSIEFKAELSRWEERALQMKKNVGYVKGTLFHHWHGPKRNRRYIDRWKILVKHVYNPLTDIKRDSQGLYQLCGNKPGLRDDLRAYFRQRSEDSIDL